MTMIGTWVPARYSFFAPPRRASADRDPRSAGVNCQCQGGRVRLSSARAAGFLVPAMGLPVPAVGQENKCVCSKPPPRPWFDRLPTGDNFFRDPGVRPCASQGEGWVARSESELTAQPDLRGSLCRSLSEPW